MKDKENNMMKTTNKMVLAIVAATAAVVGSASATPLPISGSIQFNGSHYATDLGSSGNLLGTTGTPATKVTSVTGATVTQTDGSFSVVTLGTAVTFNVPIIYRPPTADNPFWTVNDGVDTFVFFATSMQTPQDLTSGNVITETQLAGNGYVNEYADTDLTTIIGQGSGTWGMQLQKSGSLLSFQAGSTVPDGGMTLALLGGGFTALALVRSRFNKSK